MALVVTAFIILSLMLVEVQSSRINLPGNGGSVEALEVAQSGKEFYILDANNIIIPCGIKIPPSHVVVDHWWLKGQDRIAHNRLANSNLDIKLDSLTPEDEGEYRCVVKTREGVLLGPINTIINPVLRAAAEDEDIFIEGFVNQSVVLPCPINSVPIGEVRWTTAENLTLESTKYVQLFSGSLLLRDLHPQDSHIFHCIVKNQILDKEKQIRVHLSVSTNETEFGPLILGTFPDNVTLSSETNEFYCVGVGFPLPTSTWIRSYTLLGDPFLSHPQTEHMSLGSVLWLNEKNGSSKYDCVVSVGPEQISVSMDTHVAVAPSFPNLPTLRYPAAKTVRFECKPTSFAILWYKNGELLQTNSGRIKARNNELVISNSLISDSGYYQCESSKFLGTGKLIIENPVETLSPPVEIACASSSSKSILITWKVHSSGQPQIKAFSVHFTVAEGGEEKQQVTNNTSITLESLKPKTNYSIYVRAYSGKAASGQSEKVFCSTGMEDSSPSTTSTKPSNLQFYVLGNNSVRLTWERPASITGSVLSYVVEVTNTSNHKNESSVILTMTNQTSVMLENLIENTNYFVRVLAETGGPPGEYSSTIVFRILNNQSLNVTTSTSSATSGDRKDESPPSSTASNEFLGSEQKLGMILGTVLSVLCILICAAIIIFRNKCFSFLLRRGRRSRHGSYVSTGNSGKDTVDSAPLEMKVLTTHLNAQPQHLLDTKGAHLYNGGAVRDLDGASDPLVTAYQNNPERIDEGIRELSGN